MNILHYSLGFPPYRSGGLVKFCVDLMVSQRAEGHQVGLLWPGQILPWTKISIKRHKDYIGIASYEIINPLPVPLDEGVVAPEWYTQPGDILMYERFFRSLQPNVFHIHTLMGLHQECLDAAQRCGVKIVFTAHDYFGICPKVTLFRNGQPCEQDRDCKDCVVCNKAGLSLRKIAIMQSAAYRILKDFPFMKKIRKKHRNQFFEERIEEEIYGKTSNTQVELYSALRKYYFDMFSKMDVIHFNSTVTRNVYLRYFTPKKYRVVSITHNDIQDHRKMKDFSHKKIRITYLGPIKPFKGYYLLKEVLDDIWNDGRTDFELHIYNIAPNPSPYMIMQDKYHYDELEDIFNQTDFLIAPSIWYETFGFTVLEALSYGVPVIVSSHVGAKDICSGFGLVCAPTKVDLYNAILSFLDKKKLIKYNQNIFINFNFPSINDITNILYKE